MKNKLFYFAILLFLTSNLKAQISIFDAKFGKKGGTYTNLGFLNTGKLLVVQPDKRILAAGTDPDADTLGFAQNFFFVKRLNVNGTIDTTFGKKGIVSVQTIDKSFVAPINMLLQNRSEKRRVGKEC